MLTKHDCQIGIFFYMQDFEALFRDSEGLKKMMPGLCREFLIKPAFS